MDNLKEKSDLSCFVIMPGGTKREYKGGIKESKYIYKHIISKALSLFEQQIDKKIKVILETDSKVSGSITKSIIENIAKADICIVDITGLNPNVFFELGIRYSLKEKITILLKQEETNSPFDIHGYKCMKYDRFEPEVAIKGIIEFLTTGFENEDSIDSLVFETFNDLEVNIPKILSGKGSLFKKKITWGEWWAQVEDLVTMIKDDIAPRFTPNVVLGNSNGGLIVADLIGRRLFHTPPILSLWANRQELDKGNEQPFLFMSSFNDALLNNLESHFLKKNEKSKIKILLIDDIVKSSTTLFQAKKYLESKFKDRLELLFLPLYCSEPEFLKNAESILPFGYKNGLFKIKKEEYFKHIKTDKKLFPYRKKLEI